MSSWSKVVSSFWSSKCEIFPFKISHWIFWRWFFSSKICASSQIKPCYSSRLLDDKRRGSKTNDYFLSFGQFTDNRNALFVICKIKATCLLLEFNSSHCNLSLVGRLHTGIWTTEKKQPNHNTSFLLHKFSSINYSFAYQITYRLLHSRATIKAQKAVSYAQCIHIRNSLTKKN